MPHSLYLFFLPYCASLVLFCCCSIYFASWNNPYSNRHRMCLYTLISLSRYKFQFEVYRYCACVSECVCVRACYSFHLISAALIINDFRLIYPGFIILMIINVNSLSCKKFREIWPFHWHHATSSSLKYTQHRNRKENYRLFSN